MRKLALENLENVSGGFGPIGAAVGAAAGAAGYVGERLGSRQEGNLVDLAKTAGAGAVTGFLAGPLGSTALRAGAASIVGVQAGFYGGMAAGGAESMLRDPPNGNKPGNNFGGMNHR